MNIGQYISAQLKSLLDVDVEIDFYNISFEKLDKILLEYEFNKMHYSIRADLVFTKEDVEAIIALEKKYVRVINFLSKIQVNHIDRILCDEASSKMKKYDLCPEADFFKSDVSSGFKEGLIRRGSFASIETYNIMADDPIFYERYISLCSFEKLKELSKSKNKYIEYLSLKRLGPCEALDAMLNSRYANARQTGVYYSSFGYKKLEGMIDDRSPIVRQLIIEKIKTSLIPFLFGVKNSNVGDFRKRMIVKALKERMK